MISDRGDGVYWLSVYIQPGASKSEIVGPFNGSLKIRIQSPPVDGKANEALIQFLSKQLNISKRSLQIIKGEAQRNKVVQVEGISLEQIQKILK